MSNSQRRPWTRSELLLAMNLYCRIPFGRQHSRDNEVIELARILDRTPSSVAMKLNNFTSLDPEEASRGVRGLSGASRLDRSIWDEFHANWNEMAAKCELLWQETCVAKRPISECESPPEADATSRTDNEIMAETATTAERIVKVRLNQAFFRRTVLTSYNLTCCISGNPVPQLLEAAHILSWSSSPENRSNPRNGICLTRLHHAAFDAGLITLNEDLCVVLSESIRSWLPNESIRANFLAYEGCPISLPEKFLPDPKFLAFHRQHVFRP